MMDLHTYASFDATGLAELVKKERFPLMNWQMLHLSRLKMSIR